MPASGQPAPHAQTLRQARAAYKARTSPQLSDSERRQLERSIELERRAWRVKEAEKRKAEAAKKRADKEKEEREQARLGRLGSQRRCDKFGYKSSQMHLGAFLGKPKAVQMVERKETVIIRSDEVVEEGEEEFEYSPVDDETLLGVLDGIPEEQANAASKELLETNSSAFLTSKNLPTEVTNKPLDCRYGDISFDDFCTSTQIARELDEDLPRRQAPPISSTASKPATNSPNDFDDFEMTADDLLELDLIITNRKASQDRKLMPPPPLPPVKQSTPPKLADVGFTVRELEYFIDDDLQLTQADPY